MNKLYVKGREEFRNSFLLLHYSDQAQIFSTMDKEARARVYTYLSAKEFATGAMVGFICMLLITVLIMLFYKNAMLGVVVGVSIFFTLSISAVIGAVIPLIINKLKFDPAIASGPFITTLNDIIGLLIYFTTANYLIPFL